MNPILTLLAATLSGQATPQDVAPRMLAAVRHEFGSPDVIVFEEAERPRPHENEILVRVRAASVNPLDWHVLEGTPYLARPPAFGLLRPEDPRLGVDFAGTVEAVGRNVTRFRPGDDVFGGVDGALAEYVCLREDGALARKPAEVSFEQAAAVPIAALTALQALRDRARVEPGTRVLINGSSGGVGTFAVQLAKSFGAHVTGVCSTRNIELVRLLGADEVIDYTREDPAQVDRSYDVIMDNVGNRMPSDFMHLLEPNGRYVLVGGGGADDSRWLGPLPQALQALCLSWITDHELGMFMASLRSSDLEMLADMMRTGKLKPVVDRCFRFADTREALRYLEQGRARGKVVVVMDETSAAVLEKPVPPEQPESRLGAWPVALGLLGPVLAALLVPILGALRLQRRARERSPARRGFRWGYWFALEACFLGPLLAALLGCGSLTVLVTLALYVGLALAFVARRREAWIALTVLSFNPLVWAVNAVYLRKRWREA